MKSAVFTVSVLSSNVPQEKADSIGAGVRSMATFKQSPAGTHVFARRGVLQFIVGLAALPMFRTQATPDLTLVEIDGWILRVSDLA